jgi:Ser/Thr protein kinase RdoA (MazF antagonist)
MARGNVVRRWQADDVNPYSTDLSSFVRMICAGFGLPARDGVLVLVGRGAMGRVWKLTTSCGTFAVKESIWGEGWEDADAEVRFRDAAAASGVHSPTSLPVVTGGYLLSLPAVAHGTQVRLYSWVDGADLAGHDERRLAASWLGATLGRLHGLRMPPVRDPHPWYEVVPSPAEWRSLLSAAEDSGVGWYRDLAACHDRIAALTQTVTPASPQSLILCHRDVKPANVLRAADGSHVLLDWDDVGAAAPDRELASAVLRWYTDGGDIDSAAIVDTLAAYHQHGGTARLDRDSLAMQTAMSLNHLHTQAGVALDPSQPSENRDFAVDELRNALRSPPDDTAMHAVLAIALTNQA